MQKNTRRIAGASVTTADFRFERSWTSSRNVLASGSSGFSFTRIWKRGQTTTRKTWTGRSRTRSNVKFFVVVICVHTSALDYWSQVNPGDQAEQVKITRDNNHETYLRLSFFPAEPVDLRRRGSSCHALQFNATPETKYAMSGKS